MISLYNGLTDRAMLITRKITTGMLKKLFSMTYIDYKDTSDKNISANETILVSVA